MNEESRPTEDIDDQQSLDDQALDALLADVYGTSTPPDLTATILSRLNQASESSEEHARGQSLDRSGVQIATVSLPRKTVARRRSTAKRYLKVVAAIGAIAASVGLVLLTRGFNQPTPITKEKDDTKSAMVAQQSANLGDSPNQIPAVDQVAERQRNDSPAFPVGEPDGAVEPDGGRTMPAARGIPMVVANDVASEGQVDRQDGLVNRSAKDLPAASVQPIDLVAQQLDQKWQQYWQAIGVTPSDEAATDEVADRMQQTLGVKLSATKDPQKLKTQLVSKELSHQIASRWLASVSGLDTRRVESEKYAALVDDAAKAFAAKDSLGTTLINWVGGTGDATSQFYSAFSASGHDAMVRRLASVTMDVDLRCIKCHDALIDGNGRQESYWSFSSFLKQGIKRSRDGRWSVVSADQVSSKPAFYELPDGRQRFVDPAVDANWISKVAVGNSSDVGSWVAGLQRSPQLARGVVNSIWQLVHGRSLRGHVIDTMTAPHHRLLDEIQQQLADDLIDSDFDVSRTLALVIASPPTHRSSPAVLIPKNQLIASDDSIRESMHAVDAFAAALPRGGEVSLSRRLAVVMNSVGGSLKDLEGGDSLLANIGTNDASSKNSGKPNAQRENRSLDGIDFPVKSEALPVQWLSSIKSYDRRVEHLGYLASREKLSDAVMQAAEALREDGSDENLALQRVWWLIRP